MFIKEAIPILEEYLLPRVCSHMSPVDRAIAIALIALKTLNKDVEKAQDVICGDLFQINKQN